MHKSYVLAASGAAAILLAACNSEPEVVTLNKFDPMAEALKNAGPVEPPPMIQKSETYRCRDNSLVYIDFYTNKSASVRTDRRQPPIAILTAEGGNPPYTGEGYSVSGSGDSIEYTAPGKGTQTCRA